MLNDKNISITVDEVMINKENIPLISKNDLFKKSIELMCSFNLGIICVVEEKYDLVGVFTDGDLRRTLLKTQKPLSALFVDDIINYIIKDPQFVNEGSTLKDAINLMEKKRIWDLPVLDHNRKLKGLLHLHPAIKKLIDNG